MSEQTLRPTAISEENLDDLRQDNRAISELTLKLLDELSDYGIPVPPTQAYSTASIGKGYLRAMGIDPILQRQPDFPKEYLGYAQAAFYGGRTSVHIRKVICPVVYLDFLSMYSTVNTLMSLWPFVVAREIRVIKHCKSKTEAFLKSMTPDRLFLPKNWKKMNRFVKIVPNGDILPIRSKFSAASNDWQVGINHVYAAREDAMWYPIPDVLASILATGRVPEILDAFMIKPVGRIPTLRATKLLGEVEIDPAHDDFFKVIVEERLRLPSRSNLSGGERERLGKALKILASATSYGIWAQMDRTENDKKVEVVCHGIESEPFTCKVRNPDVPGEFCFPPLASLITGGARLMLALLEHCVSELGGTYMMEDTDSMAVVATEERALVPCPGGLFELKDGRKAVMSLSFQQVDEIAERFRRLCPYCDKSRSILKIERDNYDPETGEQRQIFGFAISAKRYALFVPDAGGNPVLLRKGVNNHENRWSEHGLGHLRNPLDLESEDRDWIRLAWLNIIRRELGMPTEPLSFGHLPAIGRVTITSPKVMRSLSKLNAGKERPDKLNPFDYLLSCHVKPFGHPRGVDPERFHLVAPYEANPTRWEKMLWTNQYTGEQYLITTKGFHGTRRKARVKSYADVLFEYEFHPGSKSADSAGIPSGKQTLGLLQRRHVRVGRIIYIGREANRVEEVEAGTLHSAQAVYTEYTNPRRDEWGGKILPMLRQFPVRVLMRLTNKSARMLSRTLNGRSRPRARNQVLLSSALRKIGML
jgi:hypothetical protein